jgi:hypothetical protein
MRIHSDVIGYGDICDAATKAGAELDTLSRYGSRKRANAFEIKLRGNSSRRPNFYTGDGSYAATWDQWGIVLGILFAQDPDMTIPTAYDSAAQFSLRTDGRFDDVDDMPSDLSHDHYWRYVGIPRHQACDCGASRRWDF